MLTKQGVALTFYAFYVASKAGKTGLTVTLDVFETTSGTPIVSAGSATELGDGLYYYTLASGSVDASGAYVAVFKTADSSVDQQWIPALWVTDTELKNLDAAVSTRLATADYTAPLDASGTQTAAAAALTAYDAATGADVAAIPAAPDAATVADAVASVAPADYSVGTAGYAWAAAGSAADPLLNSVPGSYASGTGGYALGRLLAISNAALYSPATRNNQFLLAAAIQGALRPVQQVTWLDGEGVALDLTDATITGIIRNRASGATRAIAGTLAITQAIDGIFTWSYDAADVADAGQFDVQFTATWEAPALSPARTFAATWAVHEALVVPD